MAILLAPVAVYKWSDGFVFLTPVLDYIQFEAAVEEVLLLVLVSAFYFRLPDVLVQFAGAESVGGLSFTTADGGHILVGGKVDHYPFWFGLWSHTLPLGGSDGEGSFVFLCHCFFPVHLGWGVEEVGAILALS